MKARDSLLPLDIAGDLLGVSNQTLRRWGRDGRINIIRLPGGSLRIRRSEVEEIIGPRDGADD